MTIWKKGADEMPPTDETEVIYQTNDGYNVAEGRFIHAVNDMLDMDMESFFWTFYTRELYVELRRQQLKQ